MLGMIGIIAVFLNIIVWFSYFNSKQRIINNAHELMNVTLDKNIENIEGWLNGSKKL